MFVQCGVILKITNKLDRSHTFYFWHTIYMQEPHRIHRISPLKINQNCYLRIQIRLYPPTTTFLIQFQCLLSDLWHISTQRKALHSMGKTNFPSYLRCDDTTVEEALLVFSLFFSVNFSIFELARARLKLWLRTPKCHQLINLTRQYLNSFQNWSSIYNLLFFFLFLSPNAT